MQKLYSFTLIVFCFCILFAKTSIGQNCSLLKASFQTTDSRCQATGSIKIFTTGGSSSYKYKVSGPVNTNFTTTDSITGLSSGAYTVVVSDIVSNCTFTQDSIIVNGSYEDPRFILTATDASCDNAANGSISVGNLENGRNPFVYTIVEPSPMGVGTSNNTGTFNNLIAGNYSIRLMDSCGGIQTREITINNYLWNINSYVFNKTSCDSVTGYVNVSDNKGHVSTEGGLPGFTYGIVRSEGDTIWSGTPYFTFALSRKSSFEVLAKDICGTLKTMAASVAWAPSVGASVNIFDKACNTFSVSLNNISNFYNPGFCLYQGRNKFINCDTIGTFTNLPYGTYCIKAHDACTDSTISRCFIVLKPVPTVANEVKISNKVCESFTASITGQANLTNPQYCLYDELNNLISCNTKGGFDSLSYGSYYIKTTDACSDSAIIRHFSASKPIPQLNAIVPAYNNCTNFGLRLSGDSLTKPSYCLYDTLGNLIQSDSSGRFDSIPLGSYCIHVHDACRDTTIIKCFSVGIPVIANNVTVSAINKTCSTFTAKTISSNIKYGATYCLYKTDSTLISCNTTGLFNGLAYSSYYVKVHSNCPDTIFNASFHAGPPIPSVASAISIIDNACSIFSAKVTGQSNLTNPQYCIYDSTDRQLSCNNTGIFNNLPYGGYCIKIINSCYDTVITRCFRASLAAMHISATVGKSCTYGFSKFNVSVSSGILPLHFQIYKPDGAIYFDTVYRTAGFSVDKIPDASVSEKYKLVITDNCGHIDSLSVAPIVSSFNHNAFVIQKCPGGSWASGSGDIKVIASTNMGSLAIKVIKKNGAILTPQLSPNAVSGDTSTFKNFGPGTYIISYKANDACGIYLYDTVTIRPYQFPNLNRSSAYKCDAGGFSVGAITSNGVGPFSYEIIGSSPSYPSITASAQADPIFNVNNGTEYSLIRLRALDACGNGTLGDASILPLAKDKIIATSNCFIQPTTLSVENIYNSTYTWYKKTNIEDADSTLISTASSYYIPTVMPEDTGVYICHIEMNGGCIKRTYRYHLNAECYNVLPVTLLNFKGKFIDDKILLNWDVTNERNVKSYIIERENIYHEFISIGKVNAARNTTGQLSYNFLDVHPNAGENYYRLKMINDDNTFTYSKIILLTNKQDGAQINIFPNPVTNLLNISFNNTGNHVYKISLYNAVNQLMKESSFTSGINSQLQISRTKAMASGMYIVRIIDENSNEQFTQKVIFK